MRVTVRPPAFATPTEVQLGATTVVPFVRCSCMKLVQRVEPHAPTHRTHPTGTYATSAAATTAAAAPTPTAATAPTIKRVVC